MAALLGLLKYLEYRYLVRDLSIELYMGVIAVMFTALGIWAGLQLMRKGKKESVAAVQVPTQPLDEEQLQKLGISKREYEVLKLIAEGCSNQEIADRLFVSLSTVKTHSSNLFAKLDVQRRTQAVKKAKLLRIL